MNKKYRIVIICCLIIGTISVAVLNTSLGAALINRDSTTLSNNLSSLVTFIGSLKKESFKQVLGAFSSSNSASFVENFDSNYTVKEVGSMSKSNNYNWWLSSGAYFYSQDGIGKTIEGPLPMLDPRRINYSISNSLDTDDGYYPQNIFRLVLRSKWKNFRQEAYFKIIKDNLSISPNRNASNGVLFFNRYQDAFNLYYTGIRVDGAAVIKKKINGIYYTLSYKSFYNSATPYDRDTNPDLIPSQQWIGLRSEVKTNPDRTVSIKVFIDKDKTGNWILAAEAKDDGKSYGGATIANEGYAGIRTDFMDVEFDDYKIVKF